MDPATAPRDSSTRGDAGVARWLAVSAVSYAVVHHLGLVPSGFGGAIDGTSIADWVDLLVPWLVLGPAARTLWLSAARPATWATFVVGAIVYTSGHGIHLAANSIGNAEPSTTSHLWDEVVSHYLWFAGVALVVASLIPPMRRLPRPGPVAWLLSLGVATTWATNAVGGHTVPLGFTLGVAATVYGARHRDDLRLVLTAFAPATIGLLLWVVR